MSQNNQRPFPAYLAVPAMQVDAGHPDAALLNLADEWNAAIASCTKAEVASAEADDRDDQTEMVATEERLERENKRVNEIGGRILLMRARTPDGILFKCRVLAYCRGDNAQSAWEKATEELSGGGCFDMAAVDSIVADVCAIGG